MMLYNARYNRL